MAIKSLHCFTPKYFASKFDVCIQRSLLPPISSPWDSVGRFCLERKISEHETGQLLITAFCYLLFLLFMPSDNT